MARTHHDASPLSLGHVPRAPIIARNALCLRATRLAVDRAGIGTTYTTSGSAAIELALHAADVQPGHSVMFPTYHCPTMIAPAVRLGAAPKFFPVSQCGAPAWQFLNDSDWVDVKAMVVVHYFGFLQPLVGLSDWCRSRGIALIEDFAHAFFSLPSAASIGSSNHFAIASLTKFFPVDEGGLLVADNEKLSTLKLAPRSSIDELRAIVDAVETSARYGRIGPLSKPLRALFAVKSVLRDMQRRVTSPRRKSAADAVASTTALDVPKLRSSAMRTTQWIVEHTDHEQIVLLRRRNYMLLAELLHEVPGLSILFPELPNNVVPYVFPVCIESLERSYLTLRARAIPVFRWDLVWPGTPTIPGDTGLQWAHQVLQVACHQDMTEQDVRDVARVIREVLENGAA